ncbi:MAG: transposase domain-containing protein, partial [Acidobacteria bacterium]|nr:transposase domain-containing protein [Acidobacteriota bacterium]
MILRMDSLSCGNLFPPTSSGDQTAASLPSVLRPAGSTQPLRAWRSLSQGLPQLSAAPESLSPSSRNRYRHHPGIPIDMPPERLSAWPGIRSGRTAAVLTSFIASCQQIKLDPWAYLRDVLTRIAAHPVNAL